MWKDSELQEHLRLKLGLTPAFRMFNWSAANRFAARRAAAEELRRELEQSLTEHPDADHFVVAHSHGGNIALAALTSRLSGALCGLACLATPVLVSRPRPYDTLAKSLFQTLAFSPLVVLLVFPEPIVLAACALWALAYGLVYWRRSAILRRAVAITANPSLAGLLHEKVLFIRATGDEASILVGAAHLLSDLVSRLLRFATGIFSEAIAETERWRGILLAKRVSLIGFLLIPAAAAWAVLLVVGAGPVELFDSDDGAPQIGRVVATVLFMSCLGFILAVGVVLLNGAWLARLSLYLVLSFLLVPVLASFCLAAVAIGPEMAVAALVREVTVEPCPPGRWPVHLVAGRRAAGTLPPDPSGLQHSSVYLAREALDSLAAWIEERRRAIRMES